MITFKIVTTQVFAIKHISKREQTKQMQEKVDIQKNQYVTFFFFSYLSFFSTKNTSVAALKFLFLFFVPVSYCLFP